MLRFCFQRIATYQKKEPHVAGNLYLSALIRRCLVAEIEANAIKAGSGQEIDVAR